MLTNQSKIIIIIIIMNLKLKNKLNLWYLLKDYVNYNKYVYIKESDLIIK